MMTRHREPGHWATRRRARTALGAGAGRKHRYVCPLVVPAVALLLAACCPYKPYDAKDPEEYDQYFRTHDSCLHWLRVER